MSTRPLMCLAALVAAGCGGAEAAEAPPAPAQPPPLEVAAGRLDDGRGWELTARGGELCLRLPDAEGCSPHAPWAVGALSAGVVYVALPSCVARLELRRGDALVGSASTATDDDVAYGVVAGPGPLGGVRLIGIGANGVRLLELDRLDGAPGERIPEIGC